MKEFEANAEEIEREFVPLMRRNHSVLLLSADDAIRLLDRCLESDVRFLGVEAFRLFPDGGIQPSIEFSNISFGKVEKVGQKTHFPGLKRGLRTPWNTDVAAIEHSKSLIGEGVTHGYTWYEVSLQHPRTNELLFFRCFDG